MRRATASGDHCFTESAASFGAPMKALIAAPSCIVSPLQGRTLRLVVTGRAQLTLCAAKRSVHRQSPRHASSKARYNETRCNCKGGNWRCWFCATLTSSWPDVIQWQTHEAGTPVRPLYRQRTPLYGQEVSDPVVSTTKLPSLGSSSRPSRADVAQLCHRYQRLYSNTVAGRSMSHPLAQ